MGPGPFEEVVGEHAAMVMRVVRALLGPTDADDAWSATFLAALEAYPQLRPESNVGGWLVTIAHRKAVDVLRARARSRVTAGPAPEHISTDDEWPVERDPALWGALQALPFKQRAAIVHHHLAGLPYAEVGVLVGSTEAAARRAAADGLARLRRTYDQGALP